MAYTHGIYEVQMVSHPTALAGATPKTGGVNLAVTGLVGEWGPVHIPHIVKGIGIQSKTTPIANAGSVVFKVDTAGVATTVVTMTFPTTVTGRVPVRYYNPTYFLEVKPGQVLQAHVTAVGPADAVISLLVEPRWEIPANVTGMSANT